MSGKKNKKIGYRQIFLIISTAFWVIYPLITRLIINKVPDIESEYFSTTKGYVVDLHMYSKEIALAGFAVVALLYFLGERIFPDKPEKIERERFKLLKWPLIFLSVYLIFTLLSFVFSDYKSTALWGVNSEYEGLIAIVCYVGTFLFACFFMKKNKDGETRMEGAEILKYGVVVLSFIIGILSIVEVFVSPILEFTFIQNLISSEENRELAHSIRNENFIGQICLTFNNPGFLGGFCSLFIPITFSISFDQKKFLRIGGIIGTGLMGLSIVWSNSNVALISLGISIPVFLFLIIKKEKKKRKPDIKRIVINTGVSLGIGLLLVTASKILPTYSSRVRPEGIPTESANNEKYKLSKAELINGELYLYSEEKLLKISVDYDVLDNLFLEGTEANFSKALIFSDGDNIINGRIPDVVKATNIREEKAGFKINDERYKAITFATDDRLFIIDLGYTGTVEFAITEDGLKSFGQGSVQMDEIPQPLVTGLEKLYSFGTGRGYIWIQSLPILLKSLFIGGGNGTFAFRFRQNEMVGLLNTHGSCKYVIDRPHNWYLQIALSNGVPALIAVLALFIWYILKFKKTYGNEVQAFDIGLFAGIIAFILCGMINDSSITVNPWFWLLFGTAVSI